MHEQVVTNPDRSRGRGVSNVAKTSIGNARSIRYRFVQGGLGANKQCHGNVYTVWVLGMSELRNRSVPIEKKSQEV